MERILKRLRSNRGETLVEALCAIMVVAITVAMFLSGIVTAVNLNGRAKSLDEENRLSSNMAEAGPWGAAGSVTFSGIHSGGSTGDRTISVKFSSDGDICSYRLP